MEAPPPQTVGGDLATAQVGLRNPGLDLEASTPELGLPSLIIFSDSWRGVGSRHRRFQAP